MEYRAKPERNRFCSDCHLPGGVLVDTRSLGGLAGAALARSLVFYGADPAAVAEGLPLSARRMDLCPPRGFSRAHWLPAWLPARARDR